MALDPQFDPQKYEKVLYQKWQDQGVFKADPQSAKKPYTIVLPPPNVTGVLHMGHALTGTLEDILIRRKRMQGFNAVWIPGTDHAGIATQMVVERDLLANEKKSRHDLGREKFLEKVWEWKGKSQNTIISQLKTLGCSLDWDRLVFTLDEKVSHSVRECFVRLYRDGLVYREQAMIQWCPRCLTALSDLEVKFKEVKGKLFRIRYPLAKSPHEFLVVATTRPETLLGDSAVAVHPQDERYQKWINQKVVLPLVNKEIPVIGDERVEKEFGTGVLKITPAHDPNDYEIGKTHQLASLSIFDEHAKINEQGGVYQGLSREKARDKVIEDLKALNLFESEENISHQVGHCDRCSTRVEPRVSAQWFVKAEVLAKPAIKAVEEKTIRIFPVEWEKTYFEWMNNIRPWCISRQLWWGHRIPVWYCLDCNHPNVAVITPEKCEKCQGRNLKQEEDVLDTWFSSGLWPFSTLGWPEETTDFKAFYPNDVLETGFDILFFWVARMVMLGIRMTGKVPFHTVYLHPMVRDEYGQKMSKTKGNVVDPLEIIDRMGADPLRFFLAWNAYHGRDLRVSDEGVQGCRNFVTKLWNVSKFVLLHFGNVTTPQADKTHPINQWIWESWNQTKKEMNQSLDHYRFFEAAQKIYHFVWNDFCDWFIELIKEPQELESRKKNLDSTALEILEEVFRALHPFMPFVTEVLWQEWPLKQKHPSISLAEYPFFDSERKHEKAHEEISALIELVEKTRTFLGTNQIANKTELALKIWSGGELLRRLQPFERQILRLTRSQSVVWEKDRPAPDIHIEIVMKGCSVFIEKSLFGNLEQEREKQKKALLEKQDALKRAQAKLGNEKFMAGAPPSVKEGVLKQARDLEAEVKAIERYLCDTEKPGETENS